MSKAKSNDKDFLHDNDNNNSKADEKKIICGVKNTQVLNVEPDLFVSATTQQRAVSQSNQKFPYTEPGCREGVHKVVRNTAMDFVVFSFESYDLVNAGISEDLKGNRFFSSHHTRGSLLGEVLYSLEGSGTPSQSFPWLQ